MARGRQIKIHLADGSVTGIRHAEIMGWTGQALAVPRSKVKELSDWEESQKPGVYFLFGINEETGNDAVYIGETEKVINRIQEHLAEKDFWNEVVCFTNKDQNLTKAHVRYLEARLVETATALNRLEIINSNKPAKSILPRGDTDVMEEFLANIRTLIGTLGYKLLEPLVKEPQPIAKPEIQETQPETLTLKHKKYKANARQTDEGIVVLSGAEAALTANPSLSKGYTKKRNDLIQKELLTEQDKKLKLVTDHLFTSPSQAAAVLLGYPTNGLDFWLDEQGKSLKEKETPPEEVK